MSDFDTILRRQAEKVSCELAAQDDAWGTSGWTRRRFLAGAGMAGVAAVGSQLVTSRAAFASTPSTDDRTLVVVFQRGAADGLRTLVPKSSALGVDYLNSLRPELMPGDAELIALPGSRGWALNAQLALLYNDLWGTGELAFVPGVSSKGVSLSHFQAQQWLEKGGSDTASTGWLERVLAKLGPGTTFRAISEGYAMPASLQGPQPSITMTQVQNFVMPGWDDIRPSSQAALLKLYRGVEGTLGTDVADCMKALGTAKKIKTSSSVTYPSGDFASSMKNLAAILKAEVGLQVATVDAGGWDTHTSEAGDLDYNLGAVASALQSFMADLGPVRRKRVTVVVMTEFGRRVEMNDSGGTDHGHGSVMWLLGGGLAGSAVYGRWKKLAPGNLDVDGNVPGFNSPFDVLGELAQKRLHVGALSAVFPGHTYTPLGLAKAA